MSALMNELEKAMYADVSWLRGLMLGWQTGTMTNHERIVAGARELKATLDGYLEQERTKDWTPEDHEAERMGGKR